MTKPASDDELPVSREQLMELFQSVQVTLGRIARAGVAEGPRTPAAPRTRRPAVKYVAFSGSDADRADKILARYKAVPG